ESFAQVERHRPERIFDAASHLLRELRIAFTHFGGRVPLPPRLVAAFCLFPLPVVPPPARQDRPFVCLAVTANAVGFAATRVDDNGVGRVVIGKADHRWRLRRDLRTSATIADVTALRAEAATFARLDHLRVSPARLAIIAPRTSCECVIGPRRPALCKADFKA